MDKPNISRVVSKAADVLEQRRKQVRVAFQPDADSVYLLSPEEQLARFLDMNPADLQQYRQMYGDDEVQEYIRQQVRNWLQHGNRIGRR